MPNVSPPHSHPLLAGYFFADAKEAKYLSQYLPCHLAMINQIPTSLLVGPAAPTAQPPAYPHRYSRDMFSLSRPILVQQPPAALAVIDDLLSGAQGNEGMSGGGRTANAPSISAAGVRALAVQPLRPTGQPKNEMMGFFDVGFLLGGGMTLSVVLPVIAFTAWTVGRKGVELALRLRK